MGQFADDGTEADAQIAALTTSVATAQAALDAETAKETADSATIAALDAEIVDLKAQIAILTPPVPTPAPIQPTQTVAVPAGATQAQIDAAKAQAASEHARLLFPAGKFSYPAPFIVPDYVAVEGAGIWNQGRADGGGGTWLACYGGQWGAKLSLAKLLIGVNKAGVTSSFSPVARGNAAAGVETQKNGSHDVVFTLVRLKGGGDTGEHLIDLANGAGYWSTATNPLRRCDMVRHIFNDCEFELVQSPNSYGVSATFAKGNPGNALNLWCDMRPGGAEVHHISFIGCHFGAKNGYHTGSDGYGLGTTILVQPGPSTYATTKVADRGPSLSGGSGIHYDPNTPGATNQYNPAFDWSQVDHQAHDITFTDCLMEYSNQSPLDICDIARQYSMWQGIRQWIADGHASSNCDDGNPAAGYGNPPGARWTTFPGGVFVTGFAMTRCYLKGTLSTGATWGVTGEITSGASYVNCYNGSNPAQIATNVGHCANTASGSFSNANRPHTVLFPVDWSGSGTSYTPSPFD